jgi:hypothetical protein
MLVSDNQCDQDVEALTLGRVGRGAHQRFDLPESRSIVVLGLDRLMSIGFLLQRITSFGGQT